MPYWIEENGEKVGPMEAIEILRRADGNTRVWDGENWFSLDELIGTDHPPANDEDVAKASFVVREKVAS